MLRVFSGLAGGLLLVLVGTAMLGLMVDSDKLFVQHFVLGLFAAVLAALVHVVTFTYLTVTGKAVRQAVALSRLDEAPLQRVQHHKKAVTRCIALAFIPLVVTLGLGVETWRHRDHATYHLVAAIVTISANAVAAAIEFRHIRRNGVLLKAVMAEYRRKGPPLVTEVNPSA